MVFALRGCKAVATLIYTLLKVFRFSQFRLVFELFGVCHQVCHCAFPCEL